MTIPINIDFSDFVRQWQLSIQQTDLLAFTLLDQLSLRFADEWRNAANVLKQSRQQYQSAIYIEKLDNYNVVVGLSGFLPNAVEQGLTAFDMKEGFEKSGKKKTKKNGGWYLTIPFRHATPTALAESSIFSTVLPQAVYQAAKRELTTSKATLPASKLPTQFQNLGTRALVIGFKGNTPNVTYQPYQHKTPIYAGLQRKDDGGHGQYVTFRRVSDLSDSNSWIHTGIQAHNLAQKTLGGLDIENIVANVKVNFAQQNL